MLKLGTIEEEAALCREANKDVKIGDLVLHLHHEVGCEPLIEPIENRISFILKNKDRAEQALRLRLMRVVRAETLRRLLPDAEREKAYAEWKKADAEWEKAYAEWEKADAEWEKAYAEREKAYAEWEKADAEWKKADASPSGRRPTPRYSRSFMPSSVLAVRGMEERSSLNSGKERADEPHSTIA